MKHELMRMLGCALIAAGCARGAVGDVDGGPRGGRARDAGLTGDGGAQGDAGDGTTDGSDSSGDGGTGDDGAAGSDSGGGDTSATNDAGSGIDDAGAPESCPATNTCETAQAMTAIAGDVGTPTAMASGTGSKFLQIEITDTGGQENGTETLRARLTLQSPPGSNYDLFVRRDDEGGHANAPRSCTKNEKSSQLATGDDVVDVSWTDIYPNNPLDSAGDALILAIEVRHVSGSCAGTWSLQVTGNAP